ncbi:MAG: hypothetical protein AAB467_03385 [Patescibacteria group bacterium]
MPKTPNTEGSGPDEFDDEESTTGESISGPINLDLKRTLDEKLGPRSEERNGPPSIFDKFNNFRHDYINKFGMIKSLLDYKQSLKTIKEKFPKLFPLPTFREAYPNEEPKEQDLANIEEVDSLIGQINGGITDGTMNETDVNEKIVKIISIIRK